MKLPLKEPISPRYLYVNPKTNVVHLIMPIMSGTDIGLDNTCKSVYSLQEFFGFAGANRQSDAVGELIHYKEALEFDLKYLPESQDKALKLERLAQVNQYLAIVRPLQQDPLVLKPLTEVFPRYPKPLEYLMNDNRANVRSIILRPADQDIQLRTTAIQPVFSLPHDVSINGQTRAHRSLFYETLIKTWRDIKFKAKSKEELVGRVVTNLAGKAVDFEVVRAQLSAEVKAYLDFDCHFNHTQGNPKVPSVAVNQPYIDKEMAIDVDNQATHQLYAKSLIQYCVPHLLEGQAGSPFNYIDNLERLSIATQLMLAEINLLCYEQGQAQADFGIVLEANIELGTQLAQAVQQALHNEVSVEESMIGFVTSRYQAFQLKNPLPAAQIAELKQRFKVHYEQIKKSPHFDEFMLLSKKPGLFFTHQGCIATPLALFMSPDFFKMDKGTQDFLKTRLKDFEQVEMPDNILPHKNEPIQTIEVNLDLSTMDNNALQAVYEDITAFENPKLKHALLTQFKHERPDFKPQINAKAFLQYVAYGQQEEAEVLLKENRELAQELLIAHNIAFTDYSHRTFKCTAYEYAYWAKDAHMMRMLEKYMNAATKSFILKRVLEIEKPENPNASPDFFANPDVQLKRNKGLEYTTKNENSETIKHNETHFSLKPLKDALKNFINVETRSGTDFEHEWVALDKLWVESVGRVQRQVPAHIAQEYCHPERSFEEVTENKSLLDASNPGNLKRQFKFFNYNTREDDLWFTTDSHGSNSGLDFSIGILRGGREGRLAAAGNNLWRALRGEQASFDLAAIEAIDKMRTSDLKQSLDNLSELRAPKPHFVTASSITIQ
jgi:hypothetical protein